MARVAVIGAGFAGHTAALYMGKHLGSKHDVTMISMSDRFVYVPSLVWVGTGRMDPEKTRFPLKPVYDKLNVNFVHGKATEVHPDEGYVVAERRDGVDGTVKVEYDYLIVATGPKLDFEATPGLGPDHGTSYSICTPAHAVEARDKYLESIERMKRGERQRIVIGIGHGSATCEGAAFEYVANVHKDLVARGVRDKADIVYLTNEPELGDFGVRGVLVKKGSETLTSEAFIGAVMKEYGIEALAGRAVTKVEPGVISWEDLEGNAGTTEYDFSMLIPRFQGMPIDYIGKDGESVNDKVVNGAGFVLVDAKYGQPFDQMSKDPDSWPAVYQNPNYSNIFAAGIAFAPPGPISVPHTNPNGTAIAPAPPRTGMVSGITGRLVAENVIDLVERGRMSHSERMTEMPAACIASMGDSLWDGSAAAIIVSPVVPDYRRYPNEGGRDMFVTHMEMGLSAAWMKRMIHTTFMHKLQGRIGWRIIPE